MNRLSNFNELVNKIASVNNVKTFYLKVDNKNQVFTNRILFSMFFEVEKKNNQISERYLSYRMSTIN